VGGSGPVVASRLLWREALRAQVEATAAEHESARARRDGTTLRTSEAVRPTACLVGRSRGSAAIGWGDSNSTATVSSTGGQGPLGRGTCGLAERWVTALARCCLWFAGRLRTQHGPTRIPCPLGRGTPPALRSSAPRTASRTNTRCLHGRCGASTGRLERPMLAWRTVPYGPRDSRSRDHRE
jgi:hypothetical protein